MVKAPILTLLIISAVSRPVLIAVCRVSLTVKASRCLTLLSAVGLGLNALGSALRLALDLAVIPRLALGLTVVL